MLKPIEPAIQKQASPNEIVQTQQPQDDESDAIAAVKDPSLVKQVQEDVKAISDKTMAADTKVADLPVMHIVPATEAKVSILGSLDKASDDKLEVQLSGWGAGLYKIRLTNYDKSLHSEEHYMIRDVVEDPDHEGSFYFPFAARQITVNGQQFQLADKRWHLDPATPGRYTLDLVDASSKTLVKLVRHYMLQGYQIECKQSIVNFTDVQLKVIWNQYGICDVTPDKASYMGDRREMATGYFDPDYDSKRKYIYANKGFVQRTKVSANIVEAQQLKAEGKPVEETVYWPTPKSPEHAEMVWTASVNRYFSLAMYRPLFTQPTDEANGKPQAILGPNGLFARIDPKLIGTPNTDRNALDYSVVMLNMTSKPITVAPGKSANIDLNLYAGPRLKEVLTAQPYASISLYDTIRYELGCTWFH